MAFFFFLWTEERIAHLALNDVTPDEFEYVVSFPDARDQSRTSGNPVAMGWTGEGRYLICVYEQIDADTVFPLTAFELKEK